MTNMSGILTRAFPILVSACACLGSFTLLYNWNEAKTLHRTADTLDRKQLLQSDQRAEFSIAERELLFAALGNEPLNANLANAAIMAKQKGKPASDSQFVDLFAFLAKLGYRDTSAQTNLIMFSGMRADLDKMLLHLDAMLRRNKRNDQIYPLLSPFEVEPETTPTMHAYLQKDPPWLESYLANVTALQQIPDLSARLNTLKVIDAKIPLPKIVYTKAADEAARRQSYALALSFQSLYYSKDRTADVNTDRNNTRFPFEWSGLSGSGYFVSPSTDGVTFDVSWDGSGSPILLRRLVSAEEKKSFSVTFVASVQKEPVLRIRKTCGNRTRLLPFEKAKGRYVFQNFNDAGCDVAVIEIVALPSNSSSSDFAIRVQ